MSARTSIPWTDVSWNPIVGCRRVSPGCEHCYAERLAATRLRHTDKYAGLAVYGSHGARWTGKVSIDEREMRAPLGWKLSQAEKAGHGRRVFVCDMGDLFYEGISDEWIAAVFGVMAARPDITFQVLTKRAERMAAWFKWAGLDRGANPAAVLLGVASSKLDRELSAKTTWPLPNVWIGVSVEDQQRANERIPYLLRCPAAVRFLSVEPMLEPVDLQVSRTPGAAEDEITEEDDALGPPLGGEDGIHWVIIGGESGPGARPCDIGWIRSAVAQCKSASIAPFVKQLGSAPLIPGTFGDGYSRLAVNEQRVGLYDRKGEDMAEWPADLRIREFPR